jgi:hypothetical protein
VENSGVGRITSTDGNNNVVFNPNAMVANQTVIGHVRAGNGWDAHGICNRGQSGAALCMGFNGDQAYWGRLANTNTMDTRMQLDGVTGNLAISGTLSQGSTASIKKDITFLDEQGMEQALKYVTETPVATYRYKTASDDSRLVYGVIAEKTPPALLGEGDKSVNLSTTIGVLMASVKAQQAHIEKLEARLQQLEGQR